MIGVLFGSPRGEPSCTPDVGSQRLEWIGFFEPRSSLTPAPLGRLGCSRIITRAQPLHCAAGMRCARQQQALPPTSPPSPTRPFHPPEATPLPLLALAASQTIPLRNTHPQTSHAAGSAASTAWRCAARALGRAGEATPRTGRQPAPVVWGHDGGRGF
jgi:hypothetical protein